MPKYIAFLRAINVGGRTVKMDVLKEYIAMPGFEQISTYIQSGNVIFEHKSKDVKKLEGAIAIQLKEKLGFEVVTIIKTPAQLTTLIDNCPFEHVAEDMALHVSFLSAVPAAEDVAALMAFQSANEQFRQVGDAIYILLKKGAYADSKFSNAFLEKKLKVAATTRNWATVNKMAAV